MIGGSSGLPARDDEAIPLSLRDELARKRSGRPHAERFEDGRKGLFKQNVSWSPDGVFAQGTRSVAAAVSPVSGASGVVPPEPHVSWVA